MNRRLLRARLHHRVKAVRGWLCWWLIIILPTHHIPWRARCIWWWALPYAGDWAYFDDPYVAAIRHRHLRLAATAA